jgi:hypothetical protein
VHDPVGHVTDVHEYPEPSKMPAFGFAAVPLPTKNRRIAPGYQPATVAADGDPTAAADRPRTGSLVDTAAAGATVRAAPSNSRRLAAATVHANGLAAGPSPEPPEANHSNTSEPTPRTPPEAAAARAAVITGADTAGADTAGADTATSATATDSSTTTGTESPPTGATTESRDGTDASTELGLTPTAPGATTAPERRSRALPADDPGTTPPPRTPETATGDSLPDEPSAEASSADAAPDEAPRPARARDGAFVDSDAADPDAAEPESALEPDDPPEPVVSANATGDATADPTPNATANAPTRPTNGAKLDDPTSVAITERRPYSIARTRPRDTRR